MVQAIGAKLAIGALISIERGVSNPSARTVHAIWLVLRLRGIIVPLDQLYRVPKEGKAYMALLDRGFLNGPLNAFELHLMDAMSKSRRSKRALPAAQEPAA